VTNPALTTACSGGLKGRGPQNNVCRVAPFLFSQYIARMLSRVRRSRGRPINAPADDAKEIVGRSVNEGSSKTCRVRRSYRHSSAILSSAWAMPLRE
jgi:hypothetical protein